MFRRRVHPWAPTAALLVLGSACSSDKVDSPTTGAITKWVVTSLTLPQAADDARLDLNGDGTPDNQLGNLFRAFAAQNIDAQVALTAALDSGTLVQLLSFQSDDPNLTTDASARAIWYVGQPTAGGFGGPHAVSGATPGAAFTGALAGASYSSENPVTTHTPVAGVIELRLFPTTALVALPLNGMHVQWSFTGTSQIVAGQINGSIRKTDVDNILIPALADAFNAVISADTSSILAQQLDGLFDTGGCGAAVAGDYHIDLCEVSTNAIISSLLAPDVQIYNASGGYAPNPANTTRDAVSFGVSFTAVPTTF